MLIPVHHPKEQARLDALYALNILDTAPEESYDNITHLASYVSGCEVALISFVDRDRQWFKSGHGTDLKQTKRTVSFCAHTILQDGAFIIEDASKDERFKDNPIVTGKPYIRFYAGVPLKDKEGFPLGSLCVIDKQPNQLNQEQVVALKKLASQVMQLLELRQQALENKRLSKELKDRNDQLEQFALVLTHDMKSPLNNIKGAMELLELEIKDKVSKDDHEYLRRIKDTVIYLREFTQNLLQYYRASELSAARVDEVQPLKVIERIKDAYTRDAKSHLSVHCEIDKLLVNQVGFEQILSNLLDNAEKYADKEVVSIMLHISESEDQYRIEVKDNGPGIHESRVKNLFELFSTSEQSRRSSGIGLATVKRITEQLGGSISLDSEVGKGSTFTVELPKPTSLSKQTT